MEGSVEEKTREEPAPDENDSTIEDEDDEYLVY
jgi:hypothetical protein